MSTGKNADGRTQSECHDVANDRLNRSQIIVERVGRRLDAHLDECVDLFLALQVDVRQ